MASVIIVYCLWIRVDFIGRHHTHTHIHTRAHLVMQAKAELMRAGIDQWRTHLHLGGFNFEANSPFAIHPSPSLALVLVSPALLCSRWGSFVPTTKDGKQINSRGLHDRWSVYDYYTQASSLRTVACIYIYIWRIRMLDYSVISWAFDSFRQPYHARQIRSKWYAYRYAILYIYIQSLNKCSSFSYLKILKNFDMHLDIWVIIYIDVYISKVKILKNRNDLMLERTAGVLLLTDLGPWIDDARVCWAWPVSIWKHPNASFALQNKWWPETIVSSKQSPTMATASSPHLLRILPTSTQQLAVDYSKSSSWALAMANNWRCLYKLTACSSEHQIIDRSISWRN